MFKYKIENNEVTIIGIRDKSLEHITIPETIEGYSVTKISYGCLWFQNKLIRINIPTSIQFLDYQQFYGCDSLRYVNDVEIKVGINMINNKFILWNKKIYVIKHQIGNDYYCDGFTNSHFISGKRYYDNFDKTSNYV